MRDARPLVRTGALQHHRNLGHTAGACPVSPWDPPANMGDVSRSHTKKTPITGVSEAASTVQQPFERETLTIPGNSSRSPGLLNNPPTFSSKPNAPLRPGSIADSSRARQSHDQLPPGRTLPDAAPRFLGSGDRGPEFAGDHGGVIDCRGSICPHRNAGRQCFCAAAVRFPNR